MNLDHLQSIAFVQKLAWSLKDARHDFAAVEVAVFPPFTDLRSVQTLISADTCRSRSAPRMSRARSGAYTGEISGAFLAALDCTYVIIGHSERRTLHHGEIRRAGRGEGQRPRSGTGSCRSSASARPRRTSRSTARARCRCAQLKAALEGARRATSIVVAYEPVWAIGSGQAATPEQAQQVCAALRAVIAEALGATSPPATRILYGGSVKAANIAGFMREPNVDGALVGGASLDIDEFASIARFQQARRHLGSRSPMHRL